MTQRRLTTDKGEIKDFPKLPLATSFILKPIKHELLTEFKYNGHLSMSDLKKEIYLRFL